MPEINVEREVLALADELEAKSARTMPNVVTVEVMAAGWLRKYVRLADDLRHAEEARGALANESTRLREVISLVANNEWIIATAYNAPDFGWVVNVKDGEPDAKGSQHYKQVMATFAESPDHAGLLGQRIHFAAQCAINAAAGAPDDA